MVGSCWEWQGGLSGKGYASMSITTNNKRQNNRRQKTILIHREFYKYYHNIENLPSNIHVHHNCYNKKCVDPSHLESIDGIEHCKMEAKKERFNGMCKSGLHRLKENEKGAGNQCRICYLNYQQSEKAHLSNLESHRKSRRKESEKAHQIRLEYQRKYRQRKKLNNIMIL